MEGVGWLREAEGRRPTSVTGPIEKSLSNFTQFYQLASQRGQQISARAPLLSQLNSIWMWLLTFLLKVSGGARRPAGNRRAHRRRRIGNKQKLLSRKHHARAVGHRTWRRPSGRRELQNTADRSNPLRRPV